MLTAGASAGAVAKRSEFRVPEGIGATHPPLAKVNNHFWHMLSSGRVGLHTGQVSISPGITKLGL